MWCPFANQYPVGNHSGPLAEHLGLILHVQAGGGSLRNYFDNPSVQASSNYWVAKDGTLEQYVDSGTRAWAQANGNASYTSVETEGEPTEALTEEQVQTLGRLVAWEHATFGWPLQLADVPGDSGFGWHGMGGGAWGGHTGCPGDLRKAQRTRILALAGGTEEDDLTPDQANQLATALQLVKDANNRVARLEAFVVRQQIIEFYAKLIGRPAHEAEIEAWQGWVGAGGTLWDMQAFFKSCAEGQAWAHNPANPDNVKAPA